ncbi:autotransporter-associated beta strand repeat protein [Opitutaceae bacterium TAV1]|nr:autotransporter-associated beta strand repeat protein [Opitutaceae bacterium TAV1]
MMGGMSFRTTTSLSRLLAVFASVTCLFPAPPSVSAASIGTVASGDWETASLWQGGVPTTADDVAIGGSPSVTITVGADVAAEARSVAIGRTDPGILVIDGSLVVGDSSTIGDDTTGAVTVSGAGFWQAGELTIGDGVAGTGTLTINGGLVTTGTHRTWLGRSLAGSSGTLILSGAGVLETGQIVRGPGAAAITFDNGVLRATADEADFLSGFPAGSVTIQTGGASIDTNGHDIGISTSLSGNGALAKTGAGTLTLSGASVYTGMTTVSGGTLVVANDQALGPYGQNAYARVTGAASTLSIDPGIVLNKNVRLQDGGTLDNQGTLVGALPVYITDGGGNVANTGTIRTSEASYEAVVAISNPDMNYLTNTGGVISSSRGNGVDASIGISITYEDTPGGPVGIINDSGVHLTNQNGGQILAPGGIAAYLSGGTQNVLVNTGGSLIEGDAGVYLESGTVTNSGGSTIRSSGSGWGYGVGLGVSTRAPRAATLENTGNSLIEGYRDGVYVENNASASHTVHNTGNSTIRSTSATGGRAGVYVTSLGGAEGWGNGTVINDAGSTIEGRRWGVYLDGGGTVINSGTLTGALATNAQNAGVAFNLDTGLSISVTGTLTNSGAINGGVRFTNITGTVTNTGAIHGNVVMAASKINKVTLGIGSTIDGDLDIGTSTSSTLTLGGATGSQLYSEAVTGSTTFRGRLAKQGAGTWIIDRAFSSTQPVSITGGTLQVGNGGTDGSIAGNVTNGGILAFNRSDTLTFTGTISGSGALRQLGGGTTILTGANTYAGGTTIGAGVLRLGAAGALPAHGALALAGGTLDLDGFSTTLGTLLLTAGSILDFGAGHSGATTLTFLDSSALGWTDTLTLHNFNVGSDSLGFSSSVGLAISQLSLIRLDGYFTSGLDSAGYVMFSAIPEPVTCTVLAGLGALALVIGFRRFRHPRRYPSAGLP